MAAPRWAAQEWANLVSCFRELVAPILAVPERLNEYSLVKVSPALPHAGRRKNGRTSQLFP